MKTLLMFLVVNAVLLLSGPLEHELFSAVEDGMILRVKACIDKKADVNAVFDGETPLSTALKRGFTDIAVLLCRNGAVDPVFSGNQQDLQKKTARYSAQCRKNRRLILEAFELYLVEAGQNSLSGCVKVSDYEKKLMQYITEAHFPSCPDRGIYLYDPETDSVQCTVHGIEKRLQ